MTKLPPGFIIPSEDEHRHDVAALDAIKDIADRHHIPLARDSGETVTAFATRVVEALADKIIDIDNDIERIEAVMPDAAQDS